MKDLISLLSPCDDLVDPLGPGRREGCDKGFHHAFIELRRLLDDNYVLLGILRMRISMTSVNKCVIGYQDTDLANVNFCRREYHVYLDVSDGLETAEVPRVLITGIIRRNSPIPGNRRTMSLCSIFSTS